ncbi:MAG TPA: SpoIID/LytB domain-containing protein [Elusimicrobiota bacterium]|nr:SpoIID/LytB domain-containing protein [Elusimicrobiota bacterium]
MIAALPLILLAAAAPAPAAETPTSASIQIAIVRQALSATIAPEGDVRVLEPGKKARPLEWKGALKLTPRVGGLRLSQLRLPTETRLEPREGAVIKVGADRYRGTLILRLDPGQTVTIVEVTPLEDYLQGVLPFEMDPDWPIEALKAQAVVARSFAYANMGKFKKDGFDLTADTRSQMYRGITEVNANVRRAVGETRGEVLGWHGQLLRVYYHACCGGRTENAAEAWGGDPAATPEPLRGVKDPWCSASPLMHWKAYFAWQDVVAAIEERRRLPGPLRSLKIGRRDLAGYVRDFIARSGGKKVDVKASDLRAALGAGDLKSTRVTRIEARKKGLEFFGSGSGHGVGLCQWGARIQAEKGRTYEQILRFYFPGADLSVVDQ